MPNYLAAYRHAKWRDSRRLDDPEARLRTRLCTSGGSQPHGCCTATRQIMWQKYDKQFGYRQSWPPKTSPIPGLTWRHSTWSCTRSTSPRTVPGLATITTQLRRRHATDSTYIRLAIQLGTAMWTLDGKLARNAADVGLPVELIT